MIKHHAHPAPVANIISIAILIPLCYNVYSISFYYKTVLYTGLERSPKSSQNLKEYVYEALDLRLHRLNTTSRLLQYTDQKRPKGYFAASHQWRVPG